MSEEPHPRPKGNLKVAGAVDGDRVGKPMPMPLVGKHEVFVVVEEALGVESLRAGEHNETE